MASNKHPGGGVGGGAGTPLFTSVGFPPQSTVNSQQAAGLSITHAITTTPTPSLHLPLGVSASSRLATASPLALPVTAAAAAGERITLQPSGGSHIATQLTHAALQSPHITAVRVVSDFLSFPNSLSFQGPLSASEALPAYSQAHPVLSFPYLLPRFPRWLQGPLRCL